MQTQQETRSDCIRQWLWKGNQANLNITCVYGLAVGLCAWSTYASKYIHRILPIKSICIDIYFEIIAHDYIIRLGYTDTSSGHDEWQATACTFKFSVWPCHFVFEFGSYFDCLLWHSSHFKRCMAGGCAL